MNRKSSKGRQEQGSLQRYGVSMKVKIRLPADRNSYSVSAIS